MTCKSTKRKKKLKKNKKEKEETYLEFTMHGALSIYLLIRIVKRTMLTKGAIYHKNKSI